MPPLVQRNARSPLEVPLKPVTVEPSKLTPPPREVLPPESMPRSCIPPALVQRKARECPVSVKKVNPVTVVPSPLIPLLCE